MGILEDIVKQDNKTSDNNPVFNWLDKAMTTKSAERKSLDLDAAKSLTRNLFVPLEGAKTAIDIGKIGTNFVAGSVSYLPSWLAGLGYTGAQTLGNAFIDSKTPGSEGYEKKTPEEIRAEAEKVKEKVGSFIPQYDIKTSEGKAVNRTIEKGFEYFNTVADALPYLVGVTKEDNPRTHMLAQFISELGMFKGVHSIGNRAFGASKRIANKVKDYKEGKGDINTDITSELDKIFKNQNIDKPTAEDLATPQSRQAYIRRVMPETAADRQAEIEAVMGEKGYKESGRVEEPSEYIIEEPRKTISGEKSVAQTNLEARTDINKKIEMMKKIQPQSSISALDNVNRIRKELGLKPYELPKRELSKEDVKVTNVKEEILTPEETIDKFNVDNPGHSVMFNGEQDLSMLNRGPMYYWTATEGKAKGATFTTDSLKPEEIQSKLTETVNRFKPSNEELDKRLNDALTKKAENGPKIEEALIKSDDIIIREKPESFVQKTNKGKTTIDLDRFPDWVETELEAIYKDPKAPKRMSGIAKQLLETGELDKPGLVKTFKKWYEGEKKKVDDIEVSDKLPENIERVDPETGREAGGWEVPERPVYKSNFQAQTDFLTGETVIKNSKGKVIKNKDIAQMYLEELGLGGKLVKDPSSGGWRVRRSAKDRKAFEERLRQEYEQQLKEEGLGEVELESSMDLFDIINNERGSVTINFKEAKDKIIKILKNEKGEIRISLKEADKIRDLLNIKGYSSNDISKALRAKGISESQIKEILHKSSVQISNKGESKFFQKGDDPNELLPRRKKQGDRFAPAVTRAMANAIATAKDIKGRFWNENWSIETGDKTFARITDVNGPKIENIFYDKIKKADADALKEFKQKQKLSKALRTNLSGKSQKRIGIYALAKQEGGEAILERMGYTDMPKLTPAEMNAYETLRSEFKEYYDRVNNAREAAGESRFPAVDNYFTWINDMNWLKEEHGIGMTENWQTMQSKLHNKQIGPSFRFAKYRGGDIPRKLELNPFTIYEKYSKAALDTIHKAEPLAQLHELLGERYGLQKNAPNLYNFLMEWRGTQTGKPHIFNIANPQTIRALRILNNNVIMGILSGTVRSALIQPTALLGSFVELNHHIVTGLVKSLDPKEWKRAYETSNTLITRSPDVAIYEAMEGSGKLLKAQRKIANAALTPLTVLDQLSATATWLGAEARAKALKMEDPVKYADSIVDKTQASAAKTNRAPIQRHILGQTVTGLQTFVINHWGWLTRDVLGIGKADRSNPETVANVMKFVMATALINSAYEDFLNIKSPVATPIREYERIKDETDDNSKAIMAASKELLEYIPIYGGTIKYGSQFGGPLVNTLWDLYSEAEKGEIGYKEVGKLMGIPGTNQFSKSYRAYEREGSLADIILGRYIETPKSGRGRTGRGSRSSR